MVDTAFAVGAALVAVAFALSTLDRFLTRRNPHEAAFCAAFVLFSAASSALAAGSAAGWSPAAFRLFYLCGAILDVPVLAVGTVYIHAGRRAGSAAAVVVGLGGAFAAGILVSAPLTQVLPHSGLAQGSQVFGPVPQVLAGVGSGAGSIVIVVGALISAWRARRGPRLAGNLLLALGVLVSGAGGLLDSVADKMTAFSVALAAGIAILFVGYLLVTASGRPAAGAVPALDAGPAAAGAAAVPGVPDRSGEARPDEVAAQRAT